MACAAAGVSASHFTRLFREWTGYSANRGMNKWRDIIDWVGGYPYEAAKADELFHFFKDRGFSLEKMRCDGGLGCHELVFRRMNG